MGQPGDDMPDVFGLFGPAPNQVVGTHTITFNDVTNAVSATDGHALPAGVTAFVSFNAPELSSFAQGAFQFVANGPANIWGYVPKEIEYFCDPAVPGVPEPTTWAMFLLGLLIVGSMRSVKRLAMG